jgi:hypothetical protein
VEAGSSNFVSLINGCHFWLENNKKLFSCTQVAVIGYWVEGLGTAHYFPTYLILYVLVFQLLNIF